MSIFNINTLSDISWTSILAKGIGEARNSDYNAFTFKQSTSVVKEALLSNRLFAEVSKIISRFDSWMLWSSGFSMFLEPQVFKLLYRNNLCWYEWSAGRMLIVYEFVRVGTYTQKPWSWIGLLRRGPSETTEIWGTVLLYRKSIPITPVWKTIEKLENCRNHKHPPHQKQVESILTILSFP